jgi:hypothetical protein
MFMINPSGYGLLPQKSQRKWGTLSQRAMFGDPILVHLDNCLHQIVQLARFDEIRATTQVPGALLIAFMRGSGEHEFGNSNEFLALCQPFKKFEAIHTPHLQIGDDEARQRVSLAVGIFAFATEVSDRFFSAVQLADGIADAGPFKGKPHQCVIVFRVIHQQNSVRFLHQ